MAGGSMAMDPNELAAILKKKEMAIREPHAYVASAFPLIIKLLQTQTRKAFNSASSPTGQAWPDIAHERARGTSGHPLRDTGELMASLTGNNQYSIQRIDGTGIIFGTNSPKAFHDKGGMVQRKSSKFLTIPASREALYVGGMRNFPRKLNIVWDEARGKGVAYERVLKKQKTKAKGAAKAKKKTARQSWLGKKLARAKKAAKGFLRQLLRKRKKQRKTATQKRAAKKKQKQSRGKFDIVVHYYLRAWVIVPQRKFLEISPETKDKAAKIIIQQMFKHMKGVI